MERLDKILTKQGIGSRKEVKKLIKAKSVMVNSEIIVKPETKLEPENCEIKINGQALNFQKHLYIMMNKPQGIVSATEDKDCKTVIDILPDEFKRKGLFPAGRLDKDTEGLIIITDDGDFAHKMLSPKKHIFKKYYAELDGEVTGDMVNRFSQGIVFKDGTKCQPAKLEILKKNSAYVEICEGKFHQVKKMFNVCGLNVTFLKRISIGNLILDSNLTIGSSRMLTKNEKSAIFIVK